jgi:hypothetical protein
MNFKHIAIAASLFAAVSTSFAADIDLTGISTSDGVAAAVSDAVEAFAAEGGMADNTAIIVQSEAGANTGVVAAIEQIGVTTSLAMITQGAGADANAKSVAYILQNTTTNAVAIINQR